MQSKANKKQLLIILSLLITAFAVLGLNKLNKDFLLLWNCNTITVTAENPLITEKVKIEFGMSVNSISRKNHSEPFDNREKFTVLYDGSQKHEIINEYGENDFLITYDNKYYLSFRHFKLSRRFQHDYNFHFYSNNNRIFVQADIQGESPMRFERVMLDIPMVGK